MDADRQLYALICAILCREHEPLQIVVSTGDLEPADTEDS